MRRVSGRALSPHSSVGRWTASPLAEEANPEEDGEPFPRGKGVRRGERRRGHMAAASQRVTPSCKRNADLRALLGRGSPEPIYNLRNIIYIVIHGLSDPREVGWGEWN